MIERLQYYNFISRITTEKLTTYTAVFWSSVKLKWKTICQINNLFKAKIYHTWSGGRMHQTVKWQQQIAHELQNILASLPVWI
jgi:hypothetical protein